MSQRLLIRAVGAMALVATAATVATVAMPAAHAAEPGQFPAERLRPATDGRGILDVESAQVLPHLQPSAATWLSYAFNPLVLYHHLPDGKVERAASLVRHRLGMSLMATLGLF